jgi:hypothetical protein
MAESRRRMRSRPAREPSTFAATKALISSSSSNIPGSGIDPVSIGLPKMGSPDNSW